MFTGFISFGRLILGTLRDLMPIILVIAFFQIVVLEQPFPDLEGVLVGLALVMVGLALFIQGLEMGLFPLGESMAGAFARKGSLAWLLAFAFSLGFGVTVAEPALIAVAGEAAAAATEAGLIADDAAARPGFAPRLRHTVALSVGRARLRARHVAIAGPARARPSLPQRNALRDQRGDYGACFQRPKRLATAGCQDHPGCRGHR